MERIALAPELEAGLVGDSLSLRGELTRLNGAALEQWLASLSGIAVLELSDLDIGDGVAATHALNAVRLLRSRTPLLRIVAAPQVLAHNLYRTGLLLDGAIALEAMREEEPYG
jgi:anti-anti-sigma regulatory factor